MSTKQEYSQSPDNAPGPPNNRADDELCGTNNGRRMCFILAMVHALLGEARIAHILNVISDQFQII